MRTSKIISFIFPHHSPEPAGGYKVVYEYANRLVADGHKVNIVYSGSLFWKKKSLYFKLTNCFRYIQMLMHGYSCRKWFNLDKRVKEQLTFSLNYRHVPKSDIYICTSPYTAMYVKDYPTENKYYFIQGYENWGAITDEILRTTYHYPLKKIVISKWLKEIIEKEESEKCTLIYNGFDFNYFKLRTPIKEKKRYKVAMVYSPLEIKGCKYGFEALKIVKQVFPQLQVTMFGSAPRPSDLPEWYTYHIRPDKELHNAIYNEAAIFLAPSLQEGWGLTIGEAMICGQAVVCTNNRGYKEMASDRINSLMCNIKNSKSLAENIIKLISDDDLRNSIAERGMKDIQKFNIEKSFLQLKSTLKLS